MQGQRPRGKRLKGDFTPPPLIGEVLGVDALSSALNSLLFTNQLLIVFLYWGAYEIKKELIYLKWLWMWKGEICKCSQRTI